ncbi:MAG: hypothetical protein V1932_04265 [Chloroflexota bacterium]
MKKIIAAIATCVIIATTILVIKPLPAMAWEQGASGAHEEINRYAINRFFSAYAGSSKYANSPIDKAALFWGPEVGASSMVVGGHTVFMRDHTFSAWVVHGGYSADEPNIWACVRHFYDPLSKNGAPQLTDHSWLHGAVYEALSAKSWTFEDPSNPFSWPKALEYYKRAMEIPVGADNTEVPGTDFRDQDIPVDSAAQARSAFLGKAFRALGESMHMIADMTQPAHNRNDSHPNGDLDPLESRVTIDTIKMVAGGQVEQEINDDINAAADAADMYERIALWTNRNFYTDDTIYDKASGINPDNWENPYPHPQFSDLNLDPKSKLKVYTKKFNGKDVPMIQQTWASYVSYQSYASERQMPFDEYQVPPSFAVGQAEVLVPVAIKANAKLANLFFPTLDLTIEVEENKDVDKSKYGQDYQEFSVDSLIEHQIENDVEWQKLGFVIKYSGPGELWTGPKGKAKKIADLKFKQGQLEQPITVFIGDKELEKADKFQVKGGDILYVVINAGGRNWKSNEYTLAASVSLTIVPNTATGEPDKAYFFAAKTDQTVQKARYDWYLDGKKVQSGTGTTYKLQPKDEGTYAIMAKLFDKDGKELASADATAYIKKPEAAASGNLAILQSCNTLQIQFVTWANWTETLHYPGTDEPPRTTTLDQAFACGLVPPADIAWNGASFSGKNDNARVSGVVSPDCSEIVSMVVTSTSSEGETSTTFAHVPLKVDERNKVALQTTKTPAELGKCVVSASAHTNDGFHERKLNSLSFEGTKWETSLKLIFQKR